MIISAPAQGWPFKNKARGMSSEEGCMNALGYVKSWELVCLKINLTVNISCC